METFYKYLKIKPLGYEENKDIFLNPEDEIIIEEKIDGANFRFTVLNGKLIFGSRTQQLTNDKGEEENISKSFKRCVNFIREKLKDKDLTIMEKLIFYGECCVKHTMNYDWDKMPPYLGFDIMNIYDKERMRYLSYNNKKAMFEYMNLDMVPLILKIKAGTITEVDDIWVPISKYAPRENPKQQAEGIVFKNYNTQIFAKYVRDEFKEDNAMAFGSNPKYNKEDNTDNSELLFKYCTNARINKIIFKLVDDGMNLELSMMKELPRQVYIDIMEEEWREILLSKKKYILDVGRFKKTLTKRCLSILKQVIVNNALEEK